MNDLATTEQPFTRPADIPRTCSDEALLEAVGMWIAAGDSDAIAEKLGISVQMMGGWTRKKGWREIVGRLDADSQIATYSTLGRVIAASGRALLDRVLLGDVVYDEDGKETRRPIPAWQLNNIMDKSIHRHLMLGDRLKGQIGSDPDAPSNQEIWAALAQLARRKPENMKTIEGELGRDAA
jgi:hypothetical protein